MKAAISIAIIIGAIFGGYKFWEYWDTVDKERDLQERQSAKKLNPQSLDGLPFQFEEPLRKAKASGTVAFKEFIGRLKTTPSVGDPRLAWIELDYVLMLAQENPVEAKKLFAEIKKRVPQDSPVYERIKSLEKTYE